MTGAIPLLFFTSGCSEQGLANIVSDPVAPEEVGPQYVEQTFDQTASGKADFLFVVDNSGSMNDLQTVLVENARRFFAKFAQLGVNYHLGVITTDMDNPSQQGQLQAKYNFAYVTPNTQKKIDEQELVDTDGELLTTQTVFEALMDVGTDGAQEEMGFDAIEYALNEYQGEDEANEGFFRAEADLHVVGITDEDDFSVENDAEDIIEEFKVLHEEKPAYFHAVAEITAGRCVLYMGALYFEVAQTLGGQTASVCDDDWSGVLDKMELQNAGRKREFTLKKIPVVDTIEMAVYAEAGGELLYEPSVGDASYDMAEYLSETNSLRFKDARDVPPLGSLVWVRYEVESSSDF